MNYDALNINVFMSATNAGRDRMLRELRRAQKKPITPFKAPQPAVPAKTPVPSTR